MLFFERIKSVTVPEAKKMIEDGNTTVIDVRSQEVYERQRVEGALLADKGNLDHVMRDVDKSQKVICYCFKGISSKAYCKRLKKAGYTNVYNLQGGFDAWRKYHL